jgi:alpha/beta hydrolase fold
VVFHSRGGGWILGDKDTHERLGCELANQAQAVVVFVSYTPAPEAHYPIQNWLAYTALHWAVANAAQISADPTRVVRTCRRPRQEHAIRPRHSAADDPRARLCRRLPWPF